MAKVSVIGLGYIGLPTASILASVGHEVIGCDIDENVVRSISSGLPHFREPDLDMLLSAAVKTGRLKAQTKPEAADFHIIAVPTPFRENHRPDLSYVDAATDAIAPFLEPATTVILESTSPVGTTERIARRLATLRPDLKLPSYASDEVLPDQVRLVHCPERILPGQMVRELVSNDRIIGGMTAACSAKATELYESFTKGACLHTDCRSAEFAKLIENSYRDVNIAFANELSLICDRLGIDVWKAIELANKHPRVSILRPGPGVGGHCIAVDPWFIVDSAPEESRLIRTAREVNDGKEEYVQARIAAALERFKSPVLAAFGLTYKPDVDDVRESPALAIVERLAKQSKTKILVCDPMLKALPASLAKRGNVKLVDMAAALSEADVVALLVGHKRFRALQSTALLNKVVIDTIGLVSTSR